MDGLTETTLCDNNSYYSIINVINNETAHIIVNTYDKSRHILFTHDFNLKDGKAFSFATNVYDYNQALQLTF